MKKYQVVVDLKCTYFFELKAKSWKEAQKKAELLAEREFENGNTEYDIDSQVSEI